MTSASTAVDASAVDETTLVTVQVNGVDSDLIRQYSYDSDVLQVGDPFSVILPDPHNRYPWLVEGMPITLHMSNRRVNGGQRVQKTLGVVTQVMRQSDGDGGTVLNVAGADLGWFLANCDAPIWKRLPGQTFQGLYDLLVDPTWGLKGFRAENDSNAKIKMGGNYARAVVSDGAGLQPYPVVQIEPGDKPADVFVQYAKLANRLVNVSADGYLQLFKPKSTGDSAYRFYHYADPARARARNNVERARLTRSLASRWNKAVCVGTRLVPLYKPGVVAPNDPNANSFRGTFTRPTRSFDVPTRAQAQQTLLPPVPFNRLAAFADPDRLNSKQAAARAKWKIQRGDFDSWTYEVTVRGHSQGGVFYEPDNLCEVFDEVFGVYGTYYVSAVRYARDDSSGTTTTLTIRLPGLLAA